MTIRLSGLLSIIFTKSKPSHALFCPSSHYSSTYGLAVFIKCAVDESTLAFNILKEKRSISEFRNDCLCLKLARLLVLSLFHNSAVQKQYLITCQVSRYWLLALQDGVGNATCTIIGPVWFIQCPI